MKSTAKSVSNEMREFNAVMDRRLAEIREAGLYRELRRIDSPQTPQLQLEGRSLLNFSSNDYLGLANDPRLKEAAIKAVELYGAGSGASRLVCGSLAPHVELEESIAAFKATQAALSFSSGYAAALGTLTALLGPDDVIVIDKRVHACIVDAAKLSGATLRVFRHNDPEDLERILRWADQRHTAASRMRRPQTLVVTESVFSMDGDRAPLREIVDLKDRFGAWLMLDEAHATGLFGSNRRGLAEAMGVGDRIEVQMGTLGKALGAAGGYICGSRALIDLLINRARSFIFSTAPVPAAAAAAQAGIKFVQSSEGNVRSRLVWQRVEQMLGSGLLPAGPPPSSDSRRSAIIPIIVGKESRAVELAQALRQQGIFAPAIRYPSVARGQARVRLTFTAAHSPEQVSRLTAALNEAGFSDRFLTPPSATRPASPDSRRA